MLNLEQFRQELNTRGVVKANRYLVTFAPPTYLSSWQTQFLSLRCDNADLPGLALATNEGLPRFGYGSNELNPYGMIFDDAQLSFVLDYQSNVHKFFYQWLNSIVNGQARGQSALNQALGTVSGATAYEVGYKDSYVTDLKISVYSGSGDDTTDTEIMRYTLYRAFPKNMPQIGLGWENNNTFLRFPVTFSYTDYQVEYF